MTWTDPSQLTVTVGDLTREPWANAVLDNLAFLYNTPAVAVRVTAAQAVSSGSDATVQWDEATWDTTGNDMWDEGSPGAVVIDRDGVYRFNCSVLWEGTSDDASKRAIFLERNGTDRLRGVQVPSVDPAEVVLSGETSLSQGDYVEFVVRQLSGQSLDLQPLRTVATVSWVRPSPGSS